MSIVETLYQTRNLSDGELTTLLETDQFDQELFRRSDGRRREFYGTDVYLRGLIELTNYCKNDCFYCGIRRSNVNLDRYRLSLDAVLNCCNTGYELGYRTFVLQGGEDPYFNEGRIVEIVSAIRKRYQDCAITLSLGEHSCESYQKFFDAGANRYLLRHETADAQHYAKLHPASMTLERRKECLWHLKEIGYQVGSGFMVGSPFQTTACLIADLRFLQQLKPSMIGIGPFLAHRDTPFSRYSGAEDGNRLSLTLRLIAVLRLMFPYALIPATTALGTIDPQGREQGLRVGANVVMPNLSPVEVRKKYELYDNKIFTGAEAAEYRQELEHRVAQVGYTIVTDIGNVKSDVSPFAR
jgi:biotin synthase